MGRPWDATPGCCRPAPAQATVLPLLGSDSILPCLPCMHTGRPVHIGQRVSAAPQHQRRSLRVLASAAWASDASGQPSTEALAALVADKERQLANMFEPGKPQPRVSGWMGGCDWFVVHAMLPTS